MFDCSVDGHFLSQLMKLSSFLFVGGHRKSNRDLWYPPTFFFFFFLLKGESIFSTNHYLIFHSTRKKWKFSISILKFKELEEKKHVTNNLDCLGARILVISLFDWRIFKGKIKFWFFLLCFLMFIFILVIIFFVY